MKTATVTHRGQSGFASLIAIIALLLAALCAMVFARSMQQVTVARSHDHALAAYYAAEGGLTKAMAAIETGGPASSSGRLGSAVYEVEAAKTGGGWKIIARGYYVSGKDKPDAKRMQKLRKGSGFSKQRITVTGKVSAGRFIIESREKIP